MIKGIEQKTVWIKRFRLNEKPLFLKGKALHYFGSLISLLILFLKGPDRNPAQLHSEKNHYYNNCKG
jgi:hypothetical protein